MKKTQLYLLTILLFSALVFSCSSEVINFSEDESLRSKIEQVYNTVEWQEENTVKRDEVIGITDGLEKPLSFFDSPAIYPNLQGFTSLDNSQLPNTLVNKMNTFLEKLPENVDENFILEQRTYVIFYIKRSLFNFQIDSWLYGKPVIQDNMYEFSVRLFSDESYRDTHFFVVKTDNDFYIDQIQIGEVVSE